MPKVPVPPRIVRYSGIFNYDNFYKTLFNLATSNGYLVLDTAHSQKEKDDGEEAEVKWEFSKEVDDYTKFTLVIYFMIQQLKGIVVKKGEKEESSNQGNAFIKVSGEVITDWQGKWDKTELLVKLRNFYERYLFKRTLDDYFVEVLKDIALIEGELKAFFDMP